MEQAGEFSAEELEALINEALEANANNLDAHRVQLVDGGVLEELATLLPQYISRGETTTVLDALRAKLYEGMKTYDNKTALRSMHAVVSACTLCEGMREPTLPRWNLVDPDVLFVFESPLRGTDADNTFVRMLKEVGFSSTRVGATSVVRCARGKKPDGTVVANCSSKYLFKEITLIAPRLLVAVGGVASSVLLGDAVRIREDRGKMFWLNSWPVLPTYAPGYAIRSEHSLKDLEADLKQAHKFIYGA